MQRALSSLEKVPLECLRWIDSYLRLSRAGSGAGILVAALYTVLSSSHMTVQSPRDIYIVGALLGVVGGCIGWLAGALLRRPLHAGTAAHPSRPGAENHGGTP